MIVVDNGGSAVADDDIELIRMPRNVGFGGGANAGFRRATELGAIAVALLNDDIEVEAGWLGPLQEALLEDATLGAVQPKLLLAGSVPARVNSVGVAIGRDGAGTDVGYGEEDGSRFAEDPPHRIVHGWRGPVQVELPKNTGGFDESYFLYYEDVDLARRGADLGWKYRCVPASRVWHRVSASTSQLGDRARWLQERNRLRFAFRFGDGAMVARAVWLSIRRLRWSPRGAHAKALVTGLASAPSALLARRRAR